MEAQRRVPYPDLVLSSAEPARAPTVTMSDRIAQPERLTALFREHYDSVWRLLRRVGLDPATADDVAQEAFVITNQRMSDIEPGRERAFAVTTALTLVRSTRRRLRREAPDDGADRMPHPSPNAEQLVEEKHRRELLDGILARLELDLRIAFVLFEIEGFTVPEIAELCGVPTGTIASRLHRAREQFQRRTEKLRASPERQPVRRP